MAFLRSRGFGGSDGEAVRSACRRPRTGCWYCCQVDTGKRTDAVPSRVNTTPGIWVFAWCPGFDSILDQRTPPIACWAIVAAVLAGAAIGREPAVAILISSFVYYGLYWYAFAWGIDSFGAFKRDVMLLKACRSPRSPSSTCKRRPDSFSSA